MSVSLYRKYRPETFEAVVGQEHIEKTLANAVEKGEPSHAYLFCGPRGTGKTTTARLLAKALLCEKAPTAQPDGTCELCLSIANGTHPDVYEMDAASHTGVDSIREEITSRLPFAPTLGAYKIYIIDEVHMLSTSAFNALLKPIEEPPSHVIFILCTTDPHKVLDTVRSRCQRFDFHRLTDAQIIGHLRYICTQEGIEADERALELIASRSLGGMRDAITSLETVANFGGHAVTLEGAESMLGDVSSEQLETLARYIAARNLPQAFVWVSSFVRTGTDMAQLAKDLAGFIRDVYVVSLINNPTDQAAILALDPDRQARIEGVAQAFGSPDRLSYVLTVLGDLMADLKNSGNERLTMEIALTRMARPQGELTLDALADRVAVLESRVVLGGDAFGGAGAGAAGGAVADTFGGSPAGAVGRASAESAPIFGGSSADSYGRGGGASGSDILAAGDMADIANSGAAAQLALNPSPSSSALSATSEMDADDSGGRAETTPLEPASAAVDAGSIRRLWMQAIDIVKKESKLTGAMLSGSEASLGTTADKLIIQLPGEGIARKQTLEGADKLELVQKALHKLSGRNYNLEYVVDDAVPMRIDAPEQFPTPDPTPNPPTPDTRNPNTSNSPPPEEPEHEALNSPPPEGFCRQAKAPVAPLQAKQVSSFSRTSGQGREATGWSNDQAAPADQPADASSSIEDILKSSFGDGFTIEELPAPVQDTVQEDSGPAYQENRLDL